MKGIFPLTFAFRSTSPARAFLLAAFVQAVVAVLAIEVHDGLQNKTSNMYWTFKGLLREDQSPWVKTAITFTSAFVAAILVMNVMWALFAYGGGMLAGESGRRVKSWL
jgi:hypothetical protein